MGRVAHSVNVLHVFFELCLLVILLISHFGFEGETLVLVAPVPGHCLPFCFSRKVSDREMFADLIVMCQFLIEVISYFGFDGRNFVFIVLVPRHCFHFIC